MHHISVWHVMVALLLIAYFFAMAGFFAYLLYGPGIDIELPSYFTTTNGTSTAPAATTTPENPLGQATSSEPAVVAPPPLAARDMLLAYPGTLFVCDANKTLKAEFREGGVRLWLSDGRGITLPQTDQRDGALYSNANSSFVFKAGGIRASLQENAVTSYANCTVAP